MRHKSTWKDHERRIARRLNGERIAVADNRSSTDVLHSVFSIECKLRKSLPTWLKKAMGQAVDAHASKIPIAVLHETGQRADNDLVVVRLKDFEALAEAYEEKNAEEYQLQELMDALDEDDIDF